MTPLIDTKSESRVLSLVAEEGRILGAARARALLEACGLQADDFSQTYARLVFEAFVSALPRGLAPIREVLWPELSKAAGEKAAWSDFERFFTPTSIGTSEEARAVAKALKDLASRRRAVEAARRIIALAETGESVGAELAAEMHDAAKTVPGFSGSWVSARRASDIAGRRIREVQDGRLSPNVPTGYPALDEAIGGLQPTLVVLCGRAGVVKSGIAASILRNVARRGQVAALFSLEDRMEWLGFRYLAHDSGVPQGVLRNRPLSESQWLNVAQADKQVAEWDSRILVDDRPRLKPGEILVGAREAFAERGACLCLIDNMTAVRFGRGERRDLDVQDFLTDARELADEFKRPFVVIAHTHNREGTKPGDLPRLADCREAPGAFENLARLALGIAYEPPPPAEHGKPPPPAPVIRVGVLKNQNGKTLAGRHIELPFQASSGLLQDAVESVPSQEAML
jgi:replicative DNA helicase